MKRTLCYLKQIALLVLISLLTIQCEDDNLSAEEKERKVVRQFSWNLMSTNYLWSAEMPDKDYKKDEDPKTFFKSLLHEKDKWSLITDDAESLKKSISGIHKSFGYELVFIKDQNSRVYGVITFVYSNSPASAKNLKRGDVIMKVNGEEIKESNFRELFYGDNINISLGTLQNNTIYDLNKSVSLSSIELNIDPFHAKKIIEQSGKKIGYLHFTSFLNSYTEKLPEIMSYYNGVDEFILDLRYNGGGSVFHAMHFASYFAPKDEQGKVFLKQIYNEKLDEHYKKTEGENYNIGYLPKNENSFDLNRIFILTTKNSASASELIINCLKPSMAVIQVGDTTHGKYAASVTIEPKDYGYSGIDNWALQPIISRVANKLDNTDFYNGFAPQPNNKIEDGADDYNYPLGDIRESYLAHTLGLINPAVSSTLKSAEKRSNFKKIGYINYIDERVRNKMFVDLKVK